MGPTGANQHPPHSGPELADRTNRSLFATAALLAIASLFACWFGTRVIINGIINYEARETAILWAEAFAHTLEDRNTDGSRDKMVPYSKTVDPENFKGLDNAIFDGKILGYRIYNRKAVIVASSQFLEIGAPPKSDEMLRAIDAGTTHTRLITPEDGLLVSKAIAPLVWAGDVKGAIQIDVDVSARSAQLNRLRYLAFCALVSLLAAVMGTLGFVAARTLQKQRAAQLELTRNMRQHRRLLDEAPDSMVIHNMKRVLYANAAAAELHGANSPDELVGIDPATLIPGDKNDLIRAHRQAALRDGKIIRTESVGRRRLDGSLVETDSMGIPIEWDGETCILIQSRDTSERRAQQRQIEEREAQLSAFIEHTRATIFIRDLEGRMVMVNRQFEEFCGLDRKDVLGRQHWSAGELGSPEVFQAEDRAVIESGEPRSLEIMLRRADGEDRLMRDDKFPIRAANGDIVGIGCLSTDITEIRQREKISRAARAEAEWAQAQLSAFLDHSPSGMYLKDRNLKVTMVNKAYERFYGLAAEEMVGRTVDNWLPKNIADEVETLDMEILRRGEMVDLEVEVENADGEVRTLVFSKFPIYAADGEIVGVGGVNTDVTDARQHEAEVRTTQARLSAYIDHIPMMVVLLDRESRILMVNGQYERFFGIDAEDMIGKTNAVRFHGEQLERIEIENRRICDDLESSEKLLPMRYAAGEERLLHQIKFPIVTGGDVPVAIGVIMSDITEQKRHELDLEAARDDAEAANRAKSAFLANMSHEIRTPMNGVFGMADLLARSQLTADQQRYLNTIRRSGEALLGVINNVLDVSRIEAGEFRLDTDSFNLHDLLAEAIELFAESASVKGVFIAHKISHNVPVWVHGDAVRLRQVLINLIGNAIKFTGDGSVVLNAICIGNTDAGALIRFEVVDSGIGIERNKVVDLFHPFHQADSSITRRFGGTGLGLAIADHIVKLMGGRLDVDSAPGQGSSFQFSIALPLDTSKTADPDETASCLRGKRLLIVDDNAVNREILSEFAKDWQTDFVAVGTAAEAQTVLREASHENRPFDVAIVDIVMPHMDGIALAKWIRRQDVPDRIELIGLTSFNWDHDSTESRVAGFSRFATKPVRREDLARLNLSASTDIVVAEPGATQTTEAPAEEIPISYDAKILLAEDNPVNLELAQEYLSRFGCAVTVASNGKQAVDQFAGGGFDLILMDVQMPEMDGIEATRRIRDLEARTGSRRIPIIAATAHAFQEDREKCILAGMDDFLSKPYTGKDIVPVLNRWLSAVHRGASAVSRDQDVRIPENREIPALLDHGTISGLRALDAPGEDRIFGKVVGIFLENTPEQLRKLEKHVSSQDFAGISLIAHSLKTSSANVAARSLSDRFRALEAAAGDGDIGPCVELLKEIGALYEDVSAALRIAAAGDTPQRKSA